MMQRIDGRDEARVVGDREGDGVMALWYGDEVGGEYAVELYDRVEVKIHGHTFDGVVTRLHPKSHEVTVRYEDHCDFYRTTGNPRTKSARVHVLAIDLIARDG